MQGKTQTLRIYTLSVPRRTVSSFNSLYKLNHIDLGHSLKSKHICCVYYRVTRREMYSAGAPNLHGELLLLFTYMVLKYDFDFLFIKIH